MTRSVLIAAIAALLGGASVAGAQTSHIFGDGGKHYQFDAMCHRPGFLPPGITLKEQVNVLGQQVWCLVRRPDPFARCVKKLAVPAAPVKKEDHGAGNPADWTGVDTLYTYVKAVGACSRAHL